MNREYIKRYVFLTRENEQVFKYENSDFMVDIICGFLTERYTNNYNYSQPLHKHPYYELHIITDGVCSFETDDKNILNVSKDEFVLFPPNVRHKIISESDRFSKIHFSFFMVAKDSEFPNFYNLVEEKSQVPTIYKTNTQIKDLIKTMLRNVKQKQYEYKNIVYFSSVSMLIEIFRKIVGNNALKSNIKINDTRVISAIEYIKSNISASLNVDEVAEHLHISTKQLVRIFKKETDTTPGAFIRNHRIKCIDDLIIDDLYIEDIASIMGYSDSSSLIKAYKRYSGTTPSRYKKSLTLN